MKTARITATAAVLCIMAAPAAWAAEVVVHQASKKFDKETVEIGKGDTIKFVNDDKIAHNVHSRSGAEKFDLGVQKPGTSSSHTFAADGTFKVRCAIHPKMKLTVKVK